MADYTPRTWVTGQQFQASDATAMSQEIAEQEDQDITQDDQLADHEGRIAAAEEAVEDKYIKPSTGIPKSDLATAVQDTLTKADADYTMPGGGIPETDLTAAVQTKLARTYPKRPRNNVVVGLGSSVTTWATYDTSYMPGCYDNFIGHMCLESMQRMRFGGVVGHGGYTQAQIISDYLPTILALNPAPGACVYFDTPFNDMAVGGLTLTQAQANFATVIDALQDRGIWPIVGTVPAHSYGDGFQTIMSQWNRWIRRYAATHGLGLIDLVTVMADIFGDGSVALNSDELHPNSKGHHQIALQALADGIADAFAPAGTVLTSKWIGDLNNLLNDGTNNIGLFNTDTNADGVADGWTVNGGSAANCSIVAPAYGDRIVGNWQRLSWTNGQAALWLTKALATGYSAGDVLAVSARIRTTGVELASASWTVVFHQYFSGGYTYPAPGSGSGGAAGYVPGGCVQWSTDVDDGLMYTEVPVLPSATQRFASIQLSGVGASGVANLDVAEFTIVNLTTGQLL